MELPSSKNISDDVRYKYATFRNWVDRHTILVIQKSAYIQSGRCVKEITEKIAHVLERALDAEDDLVIAIELNPGDFYAQEED